MAQGANALAALAKDWNLVPSTHTGQLTATSVTPFQERLEQTFTHP